MDYYDLIEYLAEMSWFEKMLCRTPIISTMELFVTLNNSFHKELHLNVAGVHVALFESLIKTMIRVWVMTSTTSLYFRIKSIILAASQSKDWVPEPN